MTSGYSMFLVKIDVIDLYIQWKISFSEKRDIIQTGSFYAIDTNKIGLHFLYVHPVHLTEFKDKTTCN